MSVLVDRFIADAAPVVSQRWVGGDVFVRGAVARGSLLFKGGRGAGGDSWRSCPPIRDGVGSTEWFTLRLGRRICIVSAGTWWVGSRDIDWEDV